MEAPARSRLLRRGLLAALLLIPILATIVARMWLPSDFVRAIVESQATAAFGTPVKIGGARVTVFPRLGLDLDQVEIGDPVQGRLDSVAIATGFALLVSRRIEEADLRLSGGHLDASVLGGLAALGASSTADVPASGSGAPFVFVSIGSVRFRNVTLVAGPERIPVNMDASFANDRLDISSLTAQVGPSTLHVEGQLSSVSRREGHFDIRADSLPVDALIAAIGALSAGSAARDTSLAPPRITAEISAPVAILGGTRVQSFAARLQTTPPGIRVDPLSFTMDDGRFEARVTVDLSGQRPTLDAGGDVSGLDVARLREPDPGGDTVTGRLGARFSLRAPAGASLPALVGSARGSVDMEIRDGRMPGIGVIRQVVIRYANRHEPVVPASGTDAFSLLKASLTLQAGTAVIDALEMSAEDFDLTGSGTLGLSSGRLSLAVDVILSEALSRQAGRDLYRYARRDNRVVLPAIVGGTLSKPTASLDIGKTAGRALQNRIEDEVKSILDRALKGMKRNVP